MNNVILTFYDKKIDPLDVDPDQIDIRDIAHSLSYQARANGHFPYFYSVAQHCLNCAKEAKHQNYSKRVQLACLLHDGSEAYISDIPRPVKQHLANYLSIEKTMQEVIYSKYLGTPLTDAEQKEISSVDDLLLSQEFLGILNKEIEIRTQVSILNHDLSERPFNAVKEEFLEVFEELTK